MMGLIDVFKIIILGPVNDMKKTPGTSLSVLLVWCCILYGTFVVYPKLAKAADVIAAQTAARDFADTAKKIQASVSSLDIRLRYDGMRRDLEQVDGELSAVDREISRLARLNAEPNDFLFDRQQRLVSRRNELTRRISTIIQQNPELVSQ